MATYTAEQIQDTLQEIQKAESLGVYVKSNDPAIQGISNSNPRVAHRDGMIIEYDVPIPLRDGTLVRGNIFRPNNPNGGKLPVLMNYSVYGKDDILEKSMFPATSGLDDSRISSYYVFEAADPIWWTRRGYIVALVDVRGSWQSEGNKHYYSRIVGLDGYDIVEWLARQAWSNGKIGLYGASAFAMVQWLIAAEQPPSLAAILPFDGMTDLYREMHHKGGIPEAQFGHIYPLLYNWGNALVEDSETAISTHPFFDEYWKNKIPALSKITCPAYVVCGWGDHGIHTRGTLNGWKQIQSKPKFLEIHGFQKWEWATTDESLNRQKAFYDTFLCGKTTEVEYWPPVRYSVRESCYVLEWRHADTFPLPDTEYLRLFPTPSKGLADVSQSEAQKFSYDAKLGDITLDLPILQPIEVCGHAKLRLWVEAQGNDNLDLFVYLQKVDSKGDIATFPWMTVMKTGPVALGWLRASRRELDETKTTDYLPVHTHARDILLSPGEIVPVDIEIHPTSCRFRAGDRLQVVISGHDYGTYPPNIPLPRHPNNINKGIHVLHFGGKYDSYLQLPVLPPVEHSMLAYGKTVKMSMVANRLAGWSDDQFVSEYTGKHASMTKALSEEVPFLRSYTQVVAIPKPELQTLGLTGEVFEVCTTLGWSTMKKLHGSFQHPNYKASAGKHIFTDPNFKGALHKVAGELMFDPIRFENRTDGLMVMVFLPRNAATLPGEESIDDKFFASRIETLKTVAAGTSLLRYVLNRGITITNSNEFFEGTQFEDADWNCFIAVEQYWFENLDKAAAFFTETRREALSVFPDAIDLNRIITVSGKENRVFSKDANF